MMDFYKKSIFIGLVYVAVILSVNAKPSKSTKTRVDIRVVRSSPHHEEVQAPAYVLAPRYHAAAEEAQSVEHVQQQQTGHLSVISESQYQTLLKQAQKALQGYDYSKLQQPEHQPEEEQAHTKVVYKPELSIKYVYTDAPTSVSYNTAPASYGTSHDDYDHIDHYSSHKFGYRVHDPHSGAAFGHSEVSEGKVTKGQYHVLLPDGRLQNVKYVADPSGYHATVSYESYKHFH